MTMNPLRWGNVPVPYSVMWTGEVPHRRPHITTEKWAGRRLQMLCDGVDAPSGKPIFTKIHAERMRRVLREQLCQMCVQPLPPVAIGFAQGLTYGGRPVLRDGLPMCPPCALDAYRACPGLPRQEAAGTLRIWEVYPGTWDFLPVILGYADPKKGGDDRVNNLLRKLGDIYTGPDILLRQFRRVTIAELEASCPPKEPA